MENIHPYQHVIVRIIKDNYVVGTGFLISDSYILTCSHVVKNANKIEVKFDFLKNKPIKEATILFNREDTLDSTDTNIDIALLKLDNFFESIETYPLISIEESKSELDIFGYDSNGGRWVEVIHRGKNADGWEQISISSQDLNIEGGFSGAPVWDSERKGVVGITVASNSNEKSKDAYFIPSAEILKINIIENCIGNHYISINPYKGLASFESKDEAHFFGREDDIEDVISKINTTSDHNLMTLVGISGVGKSSFLKAGIIPKLISKYNYLTLYLRPHNNPLKELASSLINYVEKSKTEAITNLPKLQHSFESENEYDKEVIKNTVTQIINDHSKKIILIIDQFEEVFTNTTTETRELFLKKMLYVINDNSLNVKVIFSMRVDFLDKLLDYPNYSKLFNEKSRFFLKHMNEEQLRNIIELPAKKQNVKYENGVINNILSEIKEEKGVLPLLELYLTKLWEKQHLKIISHKSCEAVGGVMSSIGNYAESVYSSFNEKEQKSIELIMLQLLFPGEGRKDTRQIATMELFNENEQKIINILATKRLVVTGKMHDGKVSVEIIHEALISNWSRLKNWIDEHRPFRIWQNRVRTQIDEWIKSNKDNSFLLRGRQIEEALEYQKKYKLPKQERNFIKISKKKEKRKTLLSILALILFILSLAFFAIYSNYQKYIANEQKNIADEIAKTSLKSYAGILIDTYKPNNKTYNAKYIDTILRISSENSDIQSEVLKLMSENPNTSQPLLSRSNVDFNKMLQLLYFNMNIKLKNEISNLIENAVWAWSDDELKTYSNLINNKDIVNLDNFYKKELWIYLSELFNFAINPKEDLLNGLFEYKYFTNEDKNISIKRGLDVLFGYEDTIKSNLYFIETNITKAQGHKKFSDNELKEKLYTQLKRIQKIGNILNKHSKKYPKKYTKQDIKKINNMFNEGVLEVKSDKKMDNDYPNFREMLPSYYKSKYQQAKHKKDLVAQERWLEEILKIIPDNPWALYKLSLIVFEKKEKNIKPYIDSNSFAPKEWIKSLSFVIEHQDANKTTDNLQKNKRKLVSDLYEQYAYFYRRNNNFRKLILENNLRLKYEISDKEKVGIYGNLSWWYLFTKEYQKSINAGNNGLKINPKKIWIYTNIAHAYLLQGKIKKAKNIYLKYRGRKIHSSQQIWDKVIVEDFKSPIQAISAISEK